MSNTGERILPVSRYYDSLNGMKRKYDRLARQEAFQERTWKNGRDGKIRKRSACGSFWEWTKWKSAPPALK